MPSPSTSYACRRPVHCGTLSSSSSHGNTSAGGFGTLTLWHEASHRPGSGRAGGAAGRPRRAAGPAPRRAAASSRSSSAIRRGEHLDRVGDRVGQVDPVGVRPLGPAALDAHGMARVADDGRVRRHVVDHDRVRADLRAVADRDRPEQLRAGADRHVVLDRRVALAGREAGAAERDALVHRHVLAHLGRLADHDADAVVDEQPVADLAHGWISMPGQRARREREHARRDRHARVASACATRWASSACTPGHAARISADETPRRGRVAIVGGGDVAPHLAGDAAQGAETEHRPKPTRAAVRAVGAPRDAHAQEAVAWRGRPGGSRPSSGRATPGQQLQRLERLQRADHARGRPEHAGVGAASARAGRRLGERAAVAGRLARPDAITSPLDAEHAGLDQRRCRAAQQAALTA